MKGTEELEILKGRYLVRDHSPLAAAQFLQELITLIYTKRRVGYFASGNARD